jgi:hypothetical protein
MVFINNEGQKIFLFFLFLDSTSKYELFAHFGDVDYLGNGAYDFLLN